jgi:predicted methyltransferase
VVAPGESAVAETLVVLAAAARGAHAAREEARDDARHATRILSLSLSLRMENDVIQI